MSTFERTHFSDQLNIATPEQVELQFQVAGIGSRFVAALLDVVILFVVYMVVILGLVLLLSGAAAEAKDAPLDTAGKWVIAIFILLNFLMVWGYFALFEAFWHGQTPGKRVMKLRVIKDSGRQITFFESLARNLLRFVDYFPGLYLVGAITMLCNQRNKRLGDMVAGTLVVHERGEEQPLLFQARNSILAPQVAASAWNPVPAWQQPGQAAIVRYPADAIAKLSPQDVMVIDAFFARMLDLPMDTRAALAYRMQAQMSTKMGVPVTEGNPERALEAMAWQRRASG